MPFCSPHRSCWLSSTPVQLPRWEWRCAGRRCCPSAPSSQRWVRRVWAAGVVLGSGWGGGRLVNATLQLLRGSARCGCIVHLNLSISCHLHACSLCSVPAACRAAPGILGRQDCGTAVSGGASWHRCNTRWAAAPLPAHLAARLLRGASQASLRSTEALLLSPPSSLQAGRPPRQHARQAGQQRCAAHPPAAAGAAAPHALPLLCGELVGVVVSWRLWAGTWLVVEGLQRGWLVPVLWLSGSDVVLRLTTCSHVTGMQPDPSTHPLTYPPTPCAAGRAQHGACFLDGAGRVAAVCSGAAARAAGPGAAATQVRLGGKRTVLSDNADAIGNEAVAHAAVRHSQLSTQPASCLLDACPPTHPIPPTPTHTHPIACCSTVTGGLSYQETLGSGLRQGLDDAYAAEVRGGCMQGLWGGVSVCKSCCWLECRCPTCKCVLTSVPSHTHADAALCCIRVPATGGSPVPPAAGAPARHGGAATAAEPSDGGHRHAAALPA